MAVPSHDLELSIDDYLKLEESSDIRHEYVGGRIFAMTGATDAHNALVTNLTALIWPHVRASGCGLYANDMKLKLSSARSFYYPDLMVSCEPYSPDSRYKEAPCFIAEVLSASTQNIDRREKLMVYQSIASLLNYAIVYPTERRIELYARKGETWSVHVFAADDVIGLSVTPQKQIHLSLGEIYQGVLPPR